jgi:antitoxin PrlF
MHVPSTSSAKVTRKGQATIPKAIRDHLKLRPGDRIAFVIAENGRVVLLPIVLDAGDLPGILAPPRRADQGTDHVLSNLKRFDRASKLCTSHLAGCVSMRCVARLTRRIHP